MDKKIALIIVGMVILLTLSACSENTPTNQSAVNSGNENELSNNDADTAQGEVAATVNGEEIAMKEYLNMLEAGKQNMTQQGMDLQSEENAEALNKLEQDIINQMINTELMIQAAKEQGYEASEADVEEKYTSTVSQYENEEQFITLLEQQNLTKEQFKQMLKDDIQISAYIEESTDITVTEEEIENYYNQVKQQIEQMPEQEGQPKQEVPALEEIRDILEDNLLNQKQQEQAQIMLEELKADSEIEIYI